MNNDCWSHGPEEIQSGSVGCTSWREVSFSLVHLYAKCVPQGLLSSFFNFTYLFLINFSFISKLIWMLLSYSFLSKSAWDINYSMLAESSKICFAPWTRSVNDWGVPFCVYRSVSKPSELPRGLLKEQFYQKWKFNPLFTTSCCYPFFLSALLSIASRTFIISLA